MSLSIKERIARQMSKAGVGAPVSPVVQQPQAPVAATVNERIAKQMHRAKVDAAVAALKTPPPDYVFREPVMPRRKFTQDEIVRAFAEDRVYDDIQPGKQKFDASRVSDMGRVRDILIQENPQEFVIGEGKQAGADGRSFRTIDQSSLEKDGYSPLHPPVEEKVVVPENTSAPTSLPPGLKIDLTGTFGVPESSAQAAVPAPKPKPVPPVDVPVKPVERTDDESVTKIELNDTQRQMLAMMRQQRQKFK